MIKKDFFKVGDRVRVKSAGRHQGSTGVITLIAGAHCEFRTDDGFKHIWATNDELELLPALVPEVKASKLTPAQQKCNHKWVMYQPFRGEAYECCALAKCGVTKADWAYDTGNELPIWQWGR